MHFATIGINCAILYAILYTPALFFFLRKGSIIISLLLVMKFDHIQLIRGMYRKIYHISLDDTASVKQKICDLIAELEHCEIT